jgi:hypothetical protein
LLLLLLLLLLQDIIETIISTENWRDMDGKSLFIGASLSIDTETELLQVGTDEDDGCGQKTLHHGL